MTERRWLAHLLALACRGRARLAALALLALGLVAAPACHAFFDPPTIVPAQPVAGDVVSVSIRGGICDTFTDRPQDTDVTQVGSAVRIVIDGIHSDDPIFCLDPVFTVVYPVGAFAPGNYTLAVVHRYQNIAGQFIEQPIGTAPFSVAAAAIPTLDQSGIVLLSVLLGLVGLWGVRRHGESAV